MVHFVDSLFWKGLVDRVLEVVGRGNVTVSWGAEMRVFELFAGLHRIQHMLPLTLNRAINTTKKPVFFLEYACCAFSCFTLQVNCLQFINLINQFGTVFLEAWFYEMTLIEQINLIFKLFNLQINLLLLLIQLTEFLIENARLIHQLLNVNFRKLHLS